MPKPKVDLVHITPQQVRELKADISSAENMLRLEGGKYIQDKAEFITDLRKKKKLLDDHTPRKLTGAAANRELKRAKEIADRIKDAMPTTREYYSEYPKGGGTNFDFERTVQQQMAFQSNAKLQKDIIIYKSIMARIDPDDPTVRNIESLRR